MKSEETTRAEVQAAFDQYYAWFSAARADLVAERVYQAPIHFLLPSGLLVAPSQDAMRTELEAMFKPMVADGYAKTEMSSPTISVLNESAAIVSGRYVRYRRDGSVMGTFGGSYIFAKTADSWRIVSFISHDANKTVRCDGSAG
jgi:hypothetical protein